MPYVDPEKNKAYHKAYSKIYNEKNKDRNRIRNNKYYLDNKENIINKQLDYYQENKEKILIRDKNRRDANPHAYMLSRAKNRAKSENLEFDLEIEDIIIPELCPILNIKLQPGYIKQVKTSPSLDRIDNTKGYVKGNVRVISNRANTYKSDMTVEIIKRLYDYVSGLV